MIKTIDLRKLIPCLLIPIFTGLIGSLFSSNAKEVYSPLNKPPFAPPSIIFPFVWTALYILIGVALYFMEESRCNKKRPRIAYGVLLSLNLLWPLFFFTFKWFSFSNVIIIALLISAIITFYFFYKCEKLAGYFMLPLIAWVMFATYLNIGVSVLN